MKIWYRIILILFVVFLAGIFLWALFSPKPDISERIQETLKEQEKQADIAFKNVIFKEIEGSIKYWELQAKSAMVNKSAGLATLKEATGNFFKQNKPVLRFHSPAALWDMKRKEILLDKPLGYDVKLEGKIAALVESLKKSKFSIFNLPQIYKKGIGYWFQARNLSWKLANQKLLCTGGIILNKGEITGYSERLEGDVGLEKVIIEGHPRVVIEPNKISPLTVEAEVFEVISKKDVILARGNPKILWEDAKIKSNDIEYRQRDNLLILNGNVVINYQDIEAWGNAAKYFTEDGNIILEGNAKAVQGENKLSGKKVGVSLKDKKISLLGEGKVIISEEELEK